MAKFKLQKNCEKEKKLMIYLSLQMFTVLMLLCFTFYFTYSILNVKNV